MSKNFIRFCLCAAVVSGALFTSCSKERLFDTDTGGDGDSPVVDTEKSPSLAFSVSSIEVAISGGTYSFVCYVSDPADDGEVSFSTEESWIAQTGFSYNGGIVKFKVGANNTTTSREGAVVVTYSYGGTSLSGAVTVTQGTTGEMVIDVVGTFTATATNYYYDGGGEHTWTVNIYENDGSATLESDGSSVYPVSEYGYYITTLTYRETGYNNRAGDMTYAAWANYEDGKITVSAAPNPIHLRSTGGYKSYLAVDGTESTDYLTGVDVVFTYDPDSDTWTSDHGVMDADCDLVTGKPVGDGVSGSGPIYDWCGPITMQKK